MGLASTSPAAVSRPRLRGVTHLFAFVCAIPLGVLLGLAADGPRAKVGAAVFAGSVVTMFGLSALYHRVTWTPARRLWARRLDHLGIFGLIAGSYTPVGLIVLGGDWRIVILSIVWAGTLAAVVIKCWWPNGPKWLAATVGIGLGWVGVVVFPQLLHKTGTLSSLLILGGGLCYSVGAVVYALRRPDPFPAVFGYHEVFHALVIAAVALQYSAIAFFVLPH